MSTTKKQDVKNAVDNGTEQLKDLFYTGVGMAALAKEKVDGLVEEQGKLSKGDGERIVNDFVADTKKATEKFNKDVKNAVTEVLEKAAYATKKELDIIKARIEELEAKGKAAADKKAKEEAASEKKEEVKETAAKKAEKTVA
jgi:polyhydroxyalkanoate synthesis regulator phasin